MDPTPVSDPARFAARLPVFAALAVLATALACGGDGTTDPPDPDPEPRPTAVEITAGDGQTATVGEALATDPTVVVTDQAGDPMAGVSVAWSTPNGQAAPATSTTDAQGEASTTWTLGTEAGAQTLSADPAGLSAVDFTASAEPGPVAALSLTPDTMRFSALAVTETAEATAEDGYGNPVASSATWTSRDPAVATVDAAGVVTAEGNGETWVVAEAGTLDDSVRVEVTQTAASITLTPAADTLNAIGDTAPLTAEVLDAGGSALPGLTPGYTSVDPAVATVDGSGTVTSVSTGTAAIVASYGSLADTATVLSRQVAASLAVIPEVEIGLDYGDTLRILVEAQDSNGVAIPSADAAITVEDGSVASLSGTLLTAGSGEGETVLTVMVAGIQFTTDVFVSSAGFDRGWRGGHTGEETSWSSPYNWSPAGYPGAPDTITVASAAYDPVLIAPDTVATLGVVAGETLDLGGSLLRLTDDVSAAGAVVNGTLEMVGPDATACGTVPTLRVVAATAGAPQPVVSLVCDLSVNGTVRSVGGLIRSQGFLLGVRP